MRKSLISAVVATSIAGLSVAALNAQDTGEAEAIDTSAIASGSYATDSAHSMVGWSVDHLGFNDYLGIFGDVTGTLELDTENLGASSVDVTIPIASVTVASAGLKDHLLRPGQEGAAPDFFGPEPEAAHFVSTSVEQTSDTTATITGDLTLNGVTSEVVIDASLAGMGTNMMNQKPTVGFHGVTTVTRSDFNLGWGIPFGLGDEVSMYITVAFEKQ